MKLAWTGHGKIVTIFDSSYQESQENLNKQSGQSIVRHPVQKVKGKENGDWHICSTELVSTFNLH